MAYGTDPVDVYGLHARQTIHSHINLFDNPIGERGEEPSPLADSKLDKPEDVLPVAIIGAGVGGLYTAMMLKSLDIPFKIIEASDHTGGRLSTYKFPGSKADEAQYYDVGAMRFPIGLPLMERLKKLFEHEDIRGKIKLIPYKFKSDKGMAYLHYNGIRIRQKDLPTPLGDVFNFSKVGVPPMYFNPSAGYNNICNNVVEEYAEALANDLREGGNKGWKKLMKKDRYSTRAYMSLDYEPDPDLEIGDHRGLPDSVINWCETMDNSTGSYDRAFSETVLEAMAFGALDSQPDWKCLDGGSAKLTDAMELALNSPASFAFNTSVTAIGLTNPDLGVDDPKSMMTVEDSHGGSQHYSHVISTLPLPVLRTLDLSNSKLSLYQRNALRQLQYGPSIKIGVQFTSAWWTHGTDKLKNKIDIVGGQSYNDMPIRTIVYPSYGLDKPSSEPAVLIVSYCWTDDAQRLGALIAKFDPTAPLKNPLAKLVLRDLAEVHNVELDFLAGQVMAIHPWDWNTDQYSMGAFAFFGPGEFKSLYPHMTLPAAHGRLHFAGEAISPRHAWVVGALDSAWRAVHELLICSALWKSKLPNFYEQWGYHQDWTHAPAVMTANEAEKAAERADEVAERVEAAGEKAQAAGEKAEAKVASMMEEAAAMGMAAKMMAVPSIKPNLHMQHLYATQPILFKSMD